MPLSRAHRGSSVRLLAHAVRQERQVVDHWATPGQASTGEFATQPESTQRQRQGGAMRNEAMGRLDVLVGSWRTTMRNAWFLEPADQKVPGSATVEWLGDAFVVFRWTMGGRCWIGHE